MASWGLQCNQVKGAHCTSRGPVQPLVCMLHILHAWGLHIDRVSVAVTSANEVGATLHAFLRLHAQVTRRCAGSTLYSACV